MKKRASIALILSLFTQSIECAVIAKGNDTSNAPFGFKTAITTRALDQSTGIFYVGLEKGDDVFTLSKISRYSGQSPTQFTGIAPSSLFAVTIEFLALSCIDGAAARLVGVRAEDFVIKRGRKKVFILKNDDTSASESSNLNDANGETSAGVVGVAASSTHIVAPVRPNSGNEFGDTDSGLALVTINSDLSLTIKDATTGLNGNKARKLDKSSDEFDGNTNDVTIIDDKPQILYDKQLNRFYVGISMKTNTNNSDIAKSVVVARINTSANNELTLQAIAPNSATSSGDDEQIVLAKVDSDQLTLAVKKLGILHASTGPSYLIVSGGSSDGSDKGNTVYALPLVDNPSNATAHGTLANKDVALVSGKFTTAATTDTEIPKASDNDAFVGRSELPIEASQCISDMMVIGDTVYVSTNVDVNSTNEPGIFYSQALFDETGKIIAWTPWTKKALPFNAFPGQKLPGDATHDGKVKFFQVDLVNGKIWFVEGTTGQVVGTTSWETPRNTSTDTPLVDQLNATMRTGIYAVLDLDQSTRGICGQTTARYALFGGADTVAFVRSSQAQSPAINSPQTVPTDFSTPENFKLSALPKDACCCQTVEYSRQLNEDGNQNYFFAGTKTGLFVFADTNKDGFTISGSVNALNAAPFANGVWHKASNITGSVLAVKTTGNTLYVLTQEVGTTLKSTVYRINFATNVDTMFASPTIIAQTGTAPLAGVELFYDIGIISVDMDNGSQEQLVLATNNGLYQSTRTGGVQAATSSANALWTLVDPTNKNIFLGIADTDNTPINSDNCPTILPTIVWPFSLTDPSFNGIFNASKLYQLIGMTTGSLVFNPGPFNSLSNAAAFTNLEPITHFFTDGARRFFVINRQSDPFTSNNLMVMPYDIASWNVNSQAQVMVADPQLKNIDAIFWIHPIGATGSLLIGTNVGLFSLD